MELLLTGITNHVSISQSYYFNSVDIVAKIHVELLSLRFPHMIAERNREESNEQVYQDIVKYIYLLSSCMYHPTTTT